MRKLRIAFLTNEFVTQAPCVGGLGNYLNRMSQTLATLGHDVEIFTLTEGLSSRRKLGGVTVHSVRSSILVPSRIEERFSSKLRFLRVGRLKRLIRGSTSLANAFMRRHTANPFDFVQSSNYGLTGLSLPDDIGLRHIVRMSSAQDLWMDDLSRAALSPKDAAHCRLEVQCMLQAAIAYAPSQYLADYFQNTHDIPVDVVRPPAFIEIQPKALPTQELPPRYLVFFGKLMLRKGSDLIAAALPQAWKHAPGLTMVWAGRETSNSRFAEFRRQWGSHAKQVHWLGALQKPELYSVLQGSDASVLPSRVDNLPNTVIESLLFNVPVIGSRGASIDELVEDGRSGELVEIGDIPALARAMVGAWRGEADWLGDGFRRPAILDQMDPKTAAENLIDLAMNREIPTISKAA